MRDVTRDALQARWTEIGDKLVTLAEEYPDDRYDARPTTEVRSFAEQLRHVAFWNDYTARCLRGEAADGSANELPRERYPAKREIVAALRGSIDDVTTALGNGRGNPDAAAQDTVVSFIEHGGEHYGQLVMYYRLAGLVPPASR